MEPMVKGGQGRTTRSVTGDSIRFGWCLVVALFSAGAILLAVVS